MAPVRTSGVSDRLPRGRHGLPHGEVVANQRRRLIQAVPGAVREKGFPDLTVEDICVRAGVSRRTFYENFRDVEDCFVVSYRQYADELMAIVGGAAAVGADWQERVRLALLALLRYLAERDDVAHVAVIEVLAAGPAGIAERDRAVGLLRSLIGDEALQAVPEPAPRLLLEVIAGAILQLIYARVDEGRSNELEGLLPTIMYLVLVSPDGPSGAAIKAGLVDAQLPSRPTRPGGGVGEEVRPPTVSAPSAMRRGEGRRLPRGRHNLSRAFVVSNQRERIIDALATVCAAKGYRAATVEDIIAKAGVSRRTFYDLFTSKQQCFLVAYEVVMERVLQAVERAYRTSQGDWPERITGVFRTLLSLLAGEPELARLVMVDVLAAGRSARAARDAALSRFEVLLDPVRARLPVPEADRALVDRAVIGGVAEALYNRIVAGEGERLADIGPDLIYCVLVPYVGHKQAMTASAAWRAQEPILGPEG